MQTPRSTTRTLIDVMRILAADIQSDDGVANAAIAEAADRLEEYLAASLSETLSAFKDIETDPTGRKPGEPGAKLDAGKPRLGLVFMGFARALEEVGKVGTFGALEYSDDGWMDVPDGRRRYTDAMFRHFIREAIGEKYDRKSGAEARSARGVECTGAAGSGVENGGNDLRDKTMIRGGSALNLQELKALADAVHAWSNCNQAWLDKSEDEPAAVVGHIDEDGNTYPVAIIDCDQYACGEDSIKLARFYAAANPATVSWLLALIDAGSGAENKSAESETVVRAVAAETERCALLCERLPYGSGGAGRTYAEAIRGIGFGSRLAKQTRTA